MDDTLLLAGLAGLAALAGVVVITSQDGGGGGGAGITPQRIPEGEQIRKKEMKATKPAPAPQPAPVQRRPVQRRRKKKAKSHIWRDEKTGHILVGTERRNTDLNILKKHGWKVQGYDKNTGRVYLKSRSGVTKFVDRSGRQFIKKGNKIMSVRTYLESKKKKKIKGKD